MENGPLDRWKETPFTWSLRSKMVTKSSLDALFRVLGAKRALPDLFYIRPLLMGGNFLDLREAFSRIHAWNEWPESWERVGEKREVLADIAREEGREVSAREGYIFAAAAYHMAQLLLFEDFRKKRELYGKCASCYRRAAPLLDPPAELVEIPFDSFRLPGVLRFPPSSSPVPVVIFVTGAVTGKEEMHLLGSGLVERGVGTLLFDGPGMGEAWEQGPLIPGCHRVAAALFDYLEGDSRVDPGRIGLFGVSFGGNVALRMAAREKRTAAVIALSAPYDLSGYGEYVLPVIEELVRYALQSDSKKKYEEWKRTFSLESSLPEIAAPLLTIGGGEDFFVPGDDTKRIHGGGKGKKKMIFFEEADHLCVDYMHELIPKVEEWLIETGYLRPEEER